MLNANNRTTEIQLCLDRLRTGDEAARGALIECAGQRLERLTRKMLHSWDRVHRWEDTSDVYQSALMRLYRALADTHPATVVDFFRLAALNIRRELFDMAKHYYGPRGEGANHATGVWTPMSDDGEPLAWEPADVGDAPDNLAAWAEFHAQVDRLPDDERVLFDLLWYQELSQAEAASLLNISERTVKRRWASARLHLHKILEGTLPGCQSAATL